MPPMRNWLPRGGSGSSSGSSSTGRRSQQFLVVATLIYALSVQYRWARSAFLTVDNGTGGSYSRRGAAKYDAEFGPPGARRWEAEQPTRRRDDSIMKEGGVHKQSSDSHLGDDEPTHNSRTKLVDQGDETATTDSPTSADAQTDAPTKPTNEPTTPAPTNNDDEPQQTRTSQAQRRVPKSIYIQYTKHGQQTVQQINLPHKSINDLETNSIPSDAPQITKKWYEPNAEDFIDGYDWSACEPMYDWQLQSYPNCNKFHELDLRHMRMINTGGSRIAFEMMSMNVDSGEVQQFVYKTIKYNKEISSKKVEEQRKDSLVMGKTSSSKFIPDIHGYCSLGVMMDFMPEGNMHDYIKASRLAGGSSLPPVDRLRLSIHIATSVADLHTIDGTPMPSIFHNDICCHQYLFQNGVFKLNDFNYARPIYINKKTNEQCTRSSFGMAMWKARSLEEMSGKLARKINVKPDKIDVYMMGNLIYYMLTDLYLFEKPKNLSWQDSGKEILAGQRSQLPEHIAKSKDPAHVAVKKALDMCWTQDWKKRPSARSISDYLIDQLREITGKDDPDVRVTLPERDPNQGSTESDYEKYND